VLAEKLDGLGAATTEAAVHEHFAVVRYLCKPFRHLTEWDEQRTGDAHLLALPGFAHVDQHRITVTQRGVCVFWTRVDLSGHGASIRSTGDQPC